MVLTEFQFEISIILPRNNKINTFKTSYFSTSRKMFHNFVCDEEKCNFVFNYSLTYRLWQIKKCNNELSQQYPRNFQPDQLLQTCLKVKICPIKMSLLCDMCAKISVNHAEMFYWVQVRIQDLVKGGAPASEAESCRCSEAELRE